MMIDNLLPNSLYDEAVKIESQMCDLQAMLITSVINAVKSVEPNITSVSVTFQFTPFGWNIEGVYLDTINGEYENEELCYEIEAFCEYNFELISKFYDLDMGNITVTFEQWEVHNV